MSRAFEESKNCENRTPWHCGVTASFGVFFHETKHDGITVFMEFMLYSVSDKYCDPLGDYNVFMTSRLLNNSEEIPKEGIVMAASKVWNCLQCNLYCVTEIGNGVGFGLMNKSVICLKYEN